MRECNVPNELCVSAGAFEEKDTNTNNVPRTHHLWFAKRRQALERPTIEWDRQRRHATDAIHKADKREREREKRTNKTMMMMMKSNKQHDFSDVCAVCCIVYTFISIVSIVRIHWTALNACLVNLWQEMLWLHQTYNITSKTERDWSEKQTKKKKKNERK